MRTHCHCESARSANLVIARRPKGAEAISVCHFITSRGVRLLRLRFRNDGGCRLGFTLIDLMVGVIIIGAWVAMVKPSLAGRGAQLVTTND